MPQVFKVDQAATFQAVAFLDCAPKIKFGSRDVQETTSDGTPKWEVQVIAGFKDMFGRAANEVLKVNIASEKNPGEGLGMYTPVHLVGFGVGVTPPEQYQDQRSGQTRVRGGSVWYRCDSIRAAAATPGK